MVRTGVGGVLKEVLGGDVPLGPWNPKPIPELIQLKFCYLMLELTPQITPILE